MPKIDVYKHKGIAIPVESAVKSKGYICPWTEELFLTKKTYVKHLNTLRVERMHKRARKLRWEKKFKDFYTQPTFKDVIRWIEINPEFFFDHAVKTGFHARRKNLEEIRKDFWVKITYLDITWHSMVSNTHECPRGGVMCWSSHEAKDGRPRGYPGWQGRIEFQTSHDLGFGSDVFRGLGVNTGTGGGISKNRYGYGVKFFASDWPGISKTVDELEEKFNRENLLNTIKTGEPDYFRVPGIKYGKPEYFR
jgi:uncharacterized C2H2 Zn-finger protein